MIRAKAGWMAAGALLGLQAPAQAETLPVAGLYAAGEDAPSGIRLMAIERFGERAGERLALAIDQQLRGAIVEGAPYFDVTFDSSRTGTFVIYDSEPGPERKPVVVEEGGPDAILRGIARTDVSDSASGTKEVKKCAARDENKKCIREDVTRYECRQLTVSLRPEVRLVSRDGRQLYSHSDSLSTSERYCADSYGSPSADKMLQVLIDRFARTVRLDLAPEYREEQVRLLESRSGIAKADHKAFRNAVKLTKNDPIGACFAFEALEAGNPQDVSILFNLGLCREGEGNLEAAQGYYQRAVATGAGKGAPEQGLARLASRWRAQDQLAVRFGEPEGNDAEPLASETAGL